MLVCRRHIFARSIAKLLLAHKAAVEGDEGFLKSFVLPCFDRTFIRIDNDSDKAVLLRDTRYFFSCGELDDDDLDAVAGGKGDTTVVRIIDVVCEIGGGMNG